MAMVNIPSTSNGSMLLSGGVVNIEATQSGVNLNLDNPINISVPNSFENNTVLVNLDQLTHPQTTWSSLLVLNKTMALLIGSWITQLP